MRLAAFLATLACFWIAAPASAQQDGMTLQPDRLPGMCITMAGTAGESLSLPCVGGPSEKFGLPGPQGGPIRHDGKCLVPRGSGYYPPLVAATCDGSPEQTWKMSESGELRSGAGRCISLLGAASRTGTLVFAGECPKAEYGEGHAWRARKVDFTNVVEASLESLARPGQCIGYDTQLALYPCTDAYRQLISFDEKALGQLRMMSSCLSGGFAFGSLRLGDCWDMPEQKWVLLDGGRIANQTVSCIEVSNEEGRDVLRTNACTRALEQQWRVRRPPPAASPPAVDAQPALAPQAIPPSIDAAAATPAADPVTNVAEPSLDVAAADAGAVAPEILITSIATLPEAPPAPPERTADLVLTTIATDPAPTPPHTPVVDVAAAVVAEPAPTPATTAAMPAPDPSAIPAPPLPAVTLAAVTLAMTLQHEQLPGMCMSLSGRDGESESRPCDGSAIQAFAFPTGAPGPIRNGDRCLAPRGKGTYQQLSTVACDGTLEQTWTVTPEGEIRSAAGRCLSLLGTSSRNGERIYAGECPVGLPAHRWRALALDPAYVHPASGMLESVSRPGKCLGTDGSLGLVACDARLGRVFSFDSSGPSQFRMMSSCLASGYVLNSLALGQCWNMPAQKWMLTASANLSNLEGKCIVVTIEEGRDVLRTAACLPVVEQQWIFKEVAP